MSIKKYRNGAWEEIGGGEKKISIDINNSAAIDIIKNLFVFTDKWRFSSSIGSYGSKFKINIVPDRTFALIRFSAIPNTVYNESTTHIIGTFKRPDSGYATVSPIGEFIIPSFDTILNSHNININISSCDLYIYSPFILKQENIIFNIFVYGPYKSVFENTDVYNLW